MKLSPRDSLLLYYESMQTAYGWTINEIDETDALLLIAQLAAKMKRDAPPPRTLRDIAF